jgi:hypothetical protein
MSGNFSSAKLKSIFDYTFPYMFAIHAVNYDTYGIWTLLKNVLIPLNVNCYILLESYQR